MQVENNHPNLMQRIDNVSLSQAFMRRRTALRTLLSTPEHEKIHQPAEVAAKLLDPQPLQPAIDSVIADSKKVLLEQTDQSKNVSLHSTKLMQIGTTLVQVTDYSPNFSDEVSFPYEQMEALRLSIQDESRDRGPLDFAQQLNVALKQSNGSLGDALWSLTLTSRMLARWLDGSIIKGLPTFTVDQKIDQMMQWRTSLRACKLPLNGVAQDTAGDTYYTWTHATAKYFYRQFQHPSVFSLGSSVLFHHGTTMMHRFIHTFNKQGVESNHSMAATYGNAIGAICVTRPLSQETFDSPGSRQPNAELQAA